MHARGVERIALQFDRDLLFLHEHRVADRMQGVMAGRVVDWLDPERRDLDRRDFVAHLAPVAAVHSSSSSGKW